MLARANAAPPPAAPLPQLRSEVHNARGMPLAGHRSHGSHNGMVRGKRGPVNHEAVSGSPRAVRARLQNQGPASNACYFAVTRRCSFVERRGPPQQGHGQDSWEPSVIEPGAFTSVGSGTEGYEASSVGILIGNNSEFSSSCGAQSRAGSSDARLRLPPQHHQHSRSTTHLDAPLHAPRGERPAPLPTPVRSMAVQTNRESILRHYRQNGGAGSGSDSEKENADQDLQDMSARSGMTGLTLCDNLSMLNTARSVFRELQYPQQAVYDKSDRMIKATSKQQPFGNTDVTEALCRAVDDEYNDVARHWDLGRPGQEKRPEDKLAAVFRKLAKRAEKRCLEAIASSKVTMPLGGNIVEPKALDDECAKLEAQIIATDRRVARMREALDGASTIVQMDPNGIVKDLMERLSRSPNPDDLLDPRVVEFENMMNDSVQGVIQRLIAAGSSSQQLPNRQKEVLLERSAAICAAAAASVPSATSVLRRIT